MTIFQRYLLKKRELKSNPKFIPTEEHKQNLLAFTKNNPGRIKVVYRERENALYLYQGMYKVALEYEEDEAVCYSFYRGRVLKDVKYLNKGE